jgi:uncharacterized membrane protein YfcA
MSVALMLGLTSTMVATAFLSGIFGMAGGLILMGVLLTLLPLPEAMALHAVTQMASNGWRGVLWVRHVHWRAASNFLAGCALAFVVWAFWRYVPLKPLAFILLSLSPFAIRLMPAGLRPDPQRLGHGLVFGAASMTLMLLAGVSGPLIDAYFVSGKLDRRQIVATKAVCQVVSHTVKLVYFGSLVGQAASLDLAMAAAAIAASIIGTSLARPFLERLSDAQFRQWTSRIITAIAVTFLAQGLYLLVWS